MGAKKKKHKKSYKSNKHVTTNKAESNPPRTAYAKYNFLLPRLKAFLADMFLINMPILYITTYVILDGKNDFLRNNLAIFICTFIYCLILCIFLYVKGQTPGFKYAEIMLCSVDSQRLGMLQILVYILIWIIELSFFLWIFMFFRKDKRTLHEVLSYSKIVHKPNPNVV